MIFPDRNMENKPTEEQLVLRSLSSQHGLSLSLWHNTLLPLWDLCIRVHVFLLSSFSPSISWTISESAFLEKVWDISDSVPCR